MRVERFSDVARFYDLVEPMLMQNEAENNFILGLAGSLLHEPPKPENVFAIIFDGDTIVAAAEMTPPWTLGGDARAGRGDGCACQMGAREYAGDE
jgi:hypothetical protein